MRDRRAAKTARFVTRLLLARAARRGRRRRRMPSTSRSPSVAPDGSRWMQQMRAGAEEVSARTGGRVDDQVLSRRRHGQRRAGAAQDPHRPAAGRRFHGRRSRRALRCVEPLRDPAVVPLARRDRCRARRARSRARGRSRAGGLRDLRVHRGRLRESAVQRADQQRRRHAAQESVGARRRRHQLPGHGGDGAFAGRAARDRRPDGAADGAHRHYVRLAGRGARAAVAHEGQVHHGAADLVFDGHLRDREGRVRGA